MNRKAILIVLAVMVCTGIYAQTAPIIQNGDMEIWLSGKPLPKQWGTFHTIIREGIFEQSADAHSGKYAIQANFTPQKEFDNRRFYTIPFNLEAGKHQLKLYMKGKGDIRFISMHKKETNAAGKNSDTNIVGTPALGKIDNADWKEYTLDYDVTEADSYQLTICINAADKLLIDDVTIDKLK